MSDSDCTRRGEDRAPLRYRAPDVEDNTPLRSSAADRPQGRCACSDDNRAGRHFAGGAYRDTDVGKIDFEGFLNPLVLQAFGEYMERHRVQSNGELRDSDNWQAGMPRSVYMKSLLRHAHDLWMEHRGYASRDGIDEALGGLLFNVCGFWLELLKERER
ncbi:MAG TPA: hypothetical protein VFH61_14860 [Thermoleophilia bacterium]|nr:hypothetical protein [Thermoleophilia bacterium]